MGKKRKPRAENYSAGWRWLALIVVQAGIGLFAMEFIMRVFPEYVPLSLVEHMPSGAKSLFAESQGIQVQNAMRGEGMLYFGDPAKDTRKPPRTDANGYRNPDIPRGELDVVLIGDSIFIAESEARDLGAVFRDHGYRAYNISMGAYGPLHYRDAYRKFIIQPGIQHRCLVLAYNSGTELSDTTKYLKVMRAKGDWRDYTDTPRIDEEPVTTGGLWSWALFKTLPVVFAKQADSASATTGASVRVVLPYHDFQASAGQLHYLNIMSTSQEDVPQAMTAYRTIAGWAEEYANAKMIIVQLPTWAGLYGDYVAGHADERLLLEMTYRWTFHNIQRELAKMDIVMIDAREALAPALQREMITISPQNVHLNERGLEVLYEFISSQIAGCKG